MLSSVIGVVAVVLAWIAIAVITFLLVRFTMRGQQQASEEREAEIIAEQTAERAAERHGLEGGAQPGRAFPAFGAPQRLGPPISST